MAERLQTLKEELVNAITHGLGIVFGLIFLPFMLVKAYGGGLVDFLAALAFGIGILMVYTSSTLYHAIQSVKWKERLRIGDHISIYFLIAGTYTPLAIRSLTHDGALFFLAIMWGLVLVGTFFKLFFTHRFEILSVALYLAMGWMVSFIAKPVLAQIPTDLLAWAIAGGIFYTVGVFFYVKSNKKYFHAIWHVFVFLGTLSHAVFVYALL